MKKRNLWLGILTLALVFGMAVMGACKSSPPVETVMPDEESAVVYFIGFKKDGASVWDGETPIADFAEGSFTGVYAWKTTPGEHYFMVNTFNWVVMRADLEANKRYYIKLEMIPNPIPFSKDFVGMRILDPKDGYQWIGYSSEPFSDEWRARYAQGKRLQEAQQQLQEAKGKQLNIDLSGINGH